MDAGDGDHRPVGRRARARGAVLTMGIDGLVGLARTIAATVVAALRRLLRRTDEPTRPAL